MDIKKSLESGTFYVTLSGQFTFHDHHVFRDILDTIASPQVSHVILYMSNLESVDSAALGMLMLAHDATEKHHKSLHIKGTSTQVRKVFELTNFYQIFKIE